MKILANILGTTILAAAYMTTAWAISRVLSIHPDRALLVVIVIVVAQIRWFMKEESPVGKGEKP